MVLTSADLHGLLLAKDSISIDGSFLLAHVLKLLLVSDVGNTVVVITSRSRASLYALALRKVGLSAGRLAAASRLVLIETNADMRKGHLLDLRKVWESIRKILFTRIGSKEGTICLDQIFLLVDDLTVGPML